MAVPVRIQWVGPEHAFGFGPDEGHPRANAENAPICGLLKILYREKAWYSSKPDRTEPVVANIWMSDTEALAETADRM